MAGCRAARAAAASVRHWSKRAMRNTAITEMLNRSHLDASFPYQRILPVLRRRPIQVSSWHRNLSFERRLDGALVDRHLRLLYRVDQIPQPSPCRGSLAVAPSAPPAA